MHNMLGPSSSELGRSLLALSAWVTLGCLSACSLQGFDYLNKGGMQSSGGSTAQSTWSGGTQSTSTSTVVGQGGAGGTTDTGGATGNDTDHTGGVTSSGGASGTGVCAAGFSICEADAGCTDLVHGSVVGATVNNCGTCGVSCSLSNAKSATCSSGKCVPACGTNFADCNGDSAANDGCEVYLNGLTQCGTDCKNAVACPTNQVCNTGQCGAAQGIVVLTVPFTASGQTQRYADKFLSLPNLIDDMVIVRLFAPGATGGTFTVFITDADYSYGESHNYPLTATNAGWTDISVPIGGVAGPFDPSSVYQVTFHITSDADVSLAGPTVVYVDSVRTARGSVIDTFDATFGNMVGSNLQVVTGSTLSWLNAIP